MLLNDTPRAAFYLLDQSSVVNHEIPESWIAIQNANKVFELTPKRWSEPGFWERFYDDDPAAIRLFDEEVKRIVTCGRLRRNPGVWLGRSNVEN